MSSSDWGDQTRGCSAWVCSKTCEDERNNHFPPSPGCALSHTGLDGAGPHCCQPRRWLTLVQLAVSPKALGTYLQSCCSGSQYPDWIVAKGRGSAFPGMTGNTGLRILFLIGLCFILSIRKNLWMILPLKTHKISLCSLPFRAVFYGIPPTSVLNKHSLLLTSLIHFVFMTSSNSWLLQSRLTLIIMFPTTSSLLLNRRSNCAYPFVGQLVTFIKKLSFTPYRSFLNWLHPTMLPFQQVLGKLKLSQVNKVF